MSDSNNTNSKRIDIEGKIREELSEVQSHKFRTAADMKQILYLENRLVQIADRRDEIRNQFSKELNKDQHTAPSSESFEYFCIEVGNDLKKSHESKKQDIIKLEEQLQVKKQKYEEEFEKMMKVLFERHRPSCDNFYGSDNKNDELMQPNYFSIWMMQSFEGLDTRTDYIKDKLKPIKHHLKLKRFEQEKLLSMRQSKSEDIKIQKRAVSRLENTEKIIENTFNDIDSNKIKSLFQGSKIENKLNIELNAYRSVSRDKDVIIHEKMLVKKRMDLSSFHQLNDCTHENLRQEALNVKKEEMKHIYKKQESENIYSGSLSQIKSNQEKFNVMMDNVMQFINVSIQKGLEPIDQNKEVFFTDHYRGSISPQMNGGLMIIQGDGKRRRDIKRKLARTNSVEIIDDLHEYTDQIKANLVLLRDHYSSFNNKHISQQQSQNEKQEDKIEKRSVLKELQKELNEHHKNYQAINPGARLNMKSLFNKNNSEYISGSPVIGSNTQNLKAGQVNNRRTTSIGGQSNSLSRLYQQKSDHDNENEIKTLFRGLGTNSEMENSTRQQLMRQETTGPQHSLTANKNNIIPVKNSKKLYRRQSLAQTANIMPKNMDRANFQTPLKLNFDNHMTPDTWMLKEKDAFMTKCFLWFLMKHTRLCRLLLFIEDATDGNFVSTELKHRSTKIQHFLESLLFHDKSIHQSLKEFRSVEDLANPGIQSLKTPNGQKNSPNDNTMLQFSPMNEPLISSKWSNDISKLRGLPREILGNLVRKPSMSVWNWFVNNCVFIQHIYNYEQLKKKIIKYKHEGQRDIEEISKLIIQDGYDLFNGNIGKLFILKTDHYKMVNEKILDQKRQGLTGKTLDMRKGKGQYLNRGSVNIANSPKKTDTLQLGKKREAVIYDKYNDVGNPNENLSDLDTISDDGLNKKDGNSRINMKNFLKQNNSVPNIAPAQNKGVQGDGKVANRGKFVSGDKIQKKNVNFFYQDFWLRKLDRQ